MIPSDLDLPTLAALTGGGVVRVILDRVEAAGFVGVKPSHGYVIQRLIEGEPTISALARSLGMTQQGASKQVRDLETLGYVERLVGPDDQRARRVRLTPLGRRMVETTRMVRAGIEAEVLEQVGARNLMAARKVLVALLSISGVDGHIGSRTVPAPSE